VLVADRGGYAVAATRDQIDAWRFEALVADGREAAARGAAGLAAERLRAALALWRGRALADVGDGCPSLAREAHRLDELRLACVEDRIDAELELARAAQLVPELEALVHEHPLRERLRRQLVLALYRAGRQADALAAYRDARDVLDAELGLEPTPELRDLETAILRHEVAPTAAAPVRHNLPAPTTSFVGRERELDALATLLRRHRLVTLTGLGGAGKTRLALEAASRQLESWRDGVWLVDLTAIADAELVPSTVAAAVGVESAAELAGELHARELLLVLDNCEHVVGACADLVADLLHACPNLRVLATSRVPLGVAGEADDALDPLPEPASVQLFLERAAAVRRGLDADEATASAICRELDGLPLAIELAAARAKALSLSDIAARLDDRFRFLRAWQRVADPRHRTLQTTMDWSYRLLTPEEQQLLRRLAVFAGGADLAAVAAVCCDDDEDTALELVGRLVDWSLVRAEAGGPTRYRLLETVRVYATAQLARDDDADAVRRRHALHFLRVAEDCNLALDALARGPQLHEPVLREQYNLRAAIDWATQADVELALRLMLALENFWVSQAVREGRRRFEQLVPRADGCDVLLRARAHRDYAACLDVLREFDAAGQMYERSRALFVEAGDDVSAAYLDYRIGIVLIHRGDRRAAIELWESSQRALEAAGDTIGLLQVTGDLGWDRVRRGELERGLELLETSLAMARRAGWAWWETQNLLKLADAAADAGRVADAERWARECLPVCLRMANRPFARQSLAILARTAAARGERDRALALWSSVEALDVPPGRFGAFNRAAYARCMPDGPRPEPLPLEAAAALALSD
jgi:predicted ATPase/DNA-binding SARP family transcriptional activator